MLIGALASAEERGLGTLHWQMLQPYAAWKQWTIKVATALTLTALLGVALPALSVIDADIVDRFWLGLRVDGGTLAFLLDNWRRWLYLIALFTLTVTGLFSSTFTRNSLHALLTTGVFSSIGAVIFRSAFAAGSYAVWSGLALNKFYSDLALRRQYVEANFSTWGIDDYMLTTRITLLVVAIAIAGFLLLLLLMGLTNHRSAEPPRTAVARQVTILIAYGVLASLLVGGGSPLLHYYLFTH